MAAKYPVCESCGSSDVKCDAWAVWDARAQEWEVGETFDMAHCETCGNECSLAWRPVAAEFAARHGLATTEEAKA